MDFFAAKTFIQEGQLENLIQQSISSFLEQDPKFQWVGLLAYLTKGDSDSYFDGPYMVLGKESMLRKDITKLAWSFREDVYGEDYFYECIWEFDIETDLTKDVEEALADHSYCKHHSGKCWSYVLEHCPIEKIELGPQSFRLIINEEQSIFSKRPPLAIEDLDLDFLNEEVEPYQLGSDSDFFKVWEQEILAYKRVIREHPLPEVVRIMLLSFKDWSPGFYLIAEFWIRNLKVEAFRRWAKREGPYAVLSGQDLYRKDIAKFKWISRTDLHGQPYFYEFIFEFCEDVKLLALVEATLAGLSLARKREQEHTLITVAENPIGEVEVGPRRFRLTLHEENCPTVHLTPPDFDDLDIDFFWARKDETRRSGTYDFWNKWGNQRRLLYYFVKHRPLENVIYLLILSYKDRYPRKDFWYHALSNETKSESHGWIEPTEDVLRQGSYKVCESESLLREDIARLRWKSGNDIEDIEYDHEQVLEFFEEVDWGPLVESTLSEKSLSKKVYGVKTVYEVENSPIVQIELKQRSLKLIANNKYHARS